MRTPLPVITDDLADLKQRLKAERHPRKRQRLHVLVLIADGHVTTRIQAASILNVDRDTIGHWLTLYTSGGLDALLDIYVPAGKAPPLTGEQLDQLKERLADPQGFESYAAIQTWIATTLGVTMSYKAVHDLVHTKLGAAPKVPRPSHKKKH